MSERIGQEGAWRMGDSAGTEKRKQAMQLLVLSFVYIVHTIIQIVMG